MAQPSSTASSRYGLSQWAKLLRPLDQYFGFFLPSSKLQAPGTGRKSDARHGGCGRSSFTQARRAYQDGTWVRASLHHVDARRLAVLRLGATRQSGVPAGCGNERDPRVGRPFLAFWSAATYSPTLKSHPRTRSLLKQRRKSFPDDF
jgi:hypothetical protein